MAIDKKERASTAIPSWQAVSALAGYPSVKNQNQSRYSDFDMIIAVYQQRLKQAKISCIPILIIGSYPHKLEHPVIPTNAWLASAPVVRYKTQRIATCTQ